VILAGVIGWSLRFVGLEGATLPAVLVAMFVVSLVPARSACAVPTRARRASGSPGAEDPGPDA
jgi:hypothetical protein